MRSSIKHIIQSPLALCLALSVQALAACGDVGADSDGEEQAVALEGDVQELEVKNATTSSYFASVTANGTGCPRGTWDVNIDPAGETFTLTFSAYETTVSPGQLIAVKDCQIGIKLHSPQGLSYSVGDFFYTGYAFLDSAGMVGTQTAGYYFQGNPVNSTSARSDLRGPFDDNYVFQDQIGLPDLVWSPCGTDRMLNIPTRIIARNNAAKTGTGYMNTLAVDGSVQLVFSLRWRVCS